MEMCFKKMPVLWDVAPCSVVEVHYQGIALMSEAEPRRQPSLYSAPWTPQILLRHVFFEVTLILSIIHAIFGFKGLMVVSFDTT